MSDPENEGDCSRGDNPPEACTSRPEYRRPPPRPGTSRSSALPENAFTQRTPEVDSASEVTRRLDESLKDFLVRKKQALKNPETPLEISGDCMLSDPFEKADKSIHMVRGRTGIITDPVMLLHKCEWDPNHPEGPARLQVCLERIEQDGLRDRCVSLDVLSHPELYKDVEAVHDLDMFYNLHHTCQQPQRDMERAATQYDSIYFNSETYNAAKRNVDAVITMVDQVSRGKLQNGLVLGRPPGHHAMKYDYNGYCYLNNVAIAANHLIHNKRARKVVIVDIDVHHGQGTQQAFYNRSDVLYLSIHRYEDGTFWPNLFESNFNFIGKGEGQGFNVNVPLNTIGLGDAEYIAIIVNLFLPIVYEFKPDFVLISAGFDASIGCPEGRMMVTPGCYQHIIQLFSGVAEGKTVAVLEGGYFLPSLAEGVASTLKGLLGDPCPLLAKLENVHPKVVETIACLRKMLSPFWNCMKVCEVYDIAEVSADHPWRKMDIKYFGYPLEPPFLTQGTYPSNSAEQSIYFARQVTALKEFRYDTVPVNLPVVYCVHDAMILHDGPAKRTEQYTPRPERPERLTKILEKMEEMSITRRLSKIEIALRDIQPYSPHAPNWIEEIENRPDTQDAYHNEYTQEAVKHSVSGLLSLTDEIMQGRAHAGVGLVRPPGHHAEYNACSGFCHANNIAYAANYLLKHYGLTRVLIVDFDIHHGNGTQQMFYTNPNVLYLSVHRFDEGKYFPHGSHGNYTYDGFGPGKGFNVNIPFNKKKMGNTEYMAAFFHLILPIMYSYQPEFLLVSAGFDAGIHDPLGGYLVTPEMFGHMVSLLRCFARSKLLLVLEGGYNLTTTSLGMVLCIKALLGDPLPLADDVFKSFEPDAINTIREVVKHFKQYFPCLEVMRPLPCVPVLYKRIERFTENNYDDGYLYKILDMSDVLDSEAVLNELESLEQE